MQKEQMEILEKFFNNSIPVLDYGHSTGVYIVHVTSANDFRREFDAFNNKNGVQFVAQSLVNNKVAVSSY